MNPLLIMEKITMRGAKRKGARKPTATLRQVKSFKHTSKSLVKRGDLFPWNKKGATFLVVEISHTKVKFEVFGLAFPMHGNMSLQFFQERVLNQSKKHAKENYRLHTW